MVITDYTKDFQIMLLCNIMHDDNLMKLANSCLTVSDFDIPACQFIYSTLLWYYREFKKLPPASTLQCELRDRILNPKKAEIQLLPEEHEHLVSVLDRIYSITEYDPDYYKTKLTDFIRHVRVTRQLSELPTNGMTDPGALIDKIINIKESLTTANAKIRITDPSDTQYANTKKEDVMRISTGQAKIDSKVSGGLMPGMVGMVTACPGIGKTTTLINFTDGAIHQGYRGLVITLELSEKRIIHRWQGIAAGIPARYFVKLIEEWPDDIIQRYAYIHSDEYIYKGYFSVVDMSTGEFTTRDIDDAIGMWIDSTRQKYGNEAAEKCKLVSVDWLDQISPGKMFRGDERGWEKYPEFLKELGKIARKYNCALWTATQGKASADGKEVLQQKDVAGAYHKNDGLDIGMGIGVIDPITGMESGNVNTINDEDDNAPDCSRKLNFSINKNRDGNPGSVVLYQGPSLKLFSSQEAWLAFLKAAEAHNFAAMFGPNKPCH